MPKRKCGNCIDWVKITSHRGKCRNPRGFYNRIRKKNDECCGWHSYKNK